MLIVPFQRVLLWTANFAPNGCIYGSKSDVEMSGTSTVFFTHSRTDNKGVACRSRNSDTLFSSLRT